MTGKFPGDHRLHPDLAEPGPDALNAGAAARDEERLPGQFFQGKEISLPLCQRVTGRHKRGPRFSGNGDPVKQFRVIGRGDQGQVRQTVIEAVQYIVSAAVPETEGDLGKLETEAGDPAGQEIGSTALDQADVQFAGKPFERTDLFPGLLRELQELLGPAVEYGPGIGQGQVPLASNKEECAQLFFQRFHLVGEGRLAHVELFRRTGDVQFFRHRDEVSESTQIHLKNLLVRYSTREVYSRNE